MEFPFDAYPCQLEYMTKVIVALQNGENALLESPTGTGKTLCLLCATLAWRESLKKEIVAQARIVATQNHTSDTIVDKLKQDYAKYKAERAEQGLNLPTIVYASRTHSQLKQVIGELKRTGFGTLKTSVLSSRQQSCLNRQIQQIEGSGINLACRSLVSRRGCRWYNNTESFFSNNSDVHQTVMDIEDLVGLGEKRTVCPYFLSREMANTSDLIFLPYNYLIDPKTRSGLDISWDNAVLIFDEAHNIESVCSSSASFDLPIGIISGSIDEVGTAAEILSSRSGDGQPSAQGKGESVMETVKNLRSLQLVLKKFEDVISSYEVPSHGITKPGEYILDLFKDLQLNQNTFSVFSSVMETAINVLTDDALESGRSMTYKMNMTRLSTLKDCLGKVLENGNVHSFSGYRVHIHKQQDKITGTMLPTLSFWCFDPGEGMAALKTGNMNIRSILLTSGTLSPLSSFANELRTDFPVRLENPHVIDKSQVWVGVVSKGPQGAALNSSYKTRNDDNYIQDLGNAIVNFARMIPDGLLVFFPSYVVMKGCIESWKTIRRGGSSIWERISQYKAPVVEPSESSMFPAAALEYKKKLESREQNGAVFYGVCRGKASEGLDFSDKAGRAVVITGIPFAMSTDPKVKIKKEVMDINSRKMKKRSQEANGSVAISDGAITGDVWYVQQAMRAVNQAIGRVIRHKDDYGAVILCDERFGSQRLSSQLSKWLRDDVVSYPTYGAATSSLAQFFKSRSTIASKKPAMISGPLQPRQSFAIPHRNESSPSLPRIHIGAVPSAMDAIGITDLVGPVAKMAPQPLPRTIQAASAPPSLLNMIDSSGLKHASKFPKKNQGTLSSCTGGEIDSLLESKEDDHRPGLHREKIAMTTDGSTKPWSRTMIRAVQEPKRAHLGAWIRSSKQATRMTTEAAHGTPRGVGEVQTVGPSSVVNKHHAMGVKQTGQLSSHQGKIPTDEHFVESTIHVEDTKKTSSSSLKASTLVANLKKQLPKGSFLQISQALRQYATTKDIEPLLATTTRELCAPSYANLSKQFRMRIPEEYREKYDAEIAAMRLRAQSTAPGVEPIQAPCCPRCQKPFSKDPFKSSCCQTVACYSCWLGAIALKTCFMCEKPVKKSMLARVTPTAGHG